MNSIFKSIGAILSGMIAIVVLSIVTDLVLEKFEIFPPQDKADLYQTWMLALALAYRSIYGVAGGYLTASLSPNYPVIHSIILGIIGTMVSAVGMVVMWNTSANWYPIALVITSLPVTWIGAQLRQQN